MKLKLMIFWGRISSSLERCSACGWFLQPFYLKLAKLRSNYWGIDGTDKKGKFKTFYMHDYCYFAKKADGFNKIVNGEFVKNEKQNA